MWFESVMQGVFINYICWVLICIPLPRYYLWGKHRRSSKLKMSGPGWHRHRPPAIDGGAGSDTTAHVQPIAGQSRLILVMINPLTVAVYDQDVGCYLSSGFIHTDQGNQSDNIFFLTLHLSSNPFRVCFHSSVSLSSSLVISNWFNHFYATYSSCSFFLSFPSSLVLCWDICSFCPSLDFSVLLTCSCLRSIAGSSVSVLQNSISSLQQKIN